jgi:hypothetical protein
MRQFPLPAVASPALPELDVSPEPAEPPEPPLVAEPAVPPLVAEPAVPVVPPVLVASLRVLQLIWFGAAAGAQRGSV